MAEEYTEEELKKVERNLVDFYNEALQYFEGITSETGVSMPKAVVRGFKKKKGQLHFFIEDKLEEILDLVDEWGVKEFFKRIDDPEILIPYIAPMSYPVFVHRATGKPGLWSSTIDVNTSSPDFPAYLKHSTLYELSTLHEMAHVMQLGLRIEGIEFQKGDNEIVDKYMAKKNPEQIPNDQVDFHYDYNFATVLYYVAKSIIKDRAFFERVKERREVEGEEVEWLMHQMWQWTGNYFPKSYFEKFVEDACDRVGLLIKENYDLPPEEELFGED